MNRPPPPPFDPDHDCTDPSPRQAIVAGGCFWCIEGAFSLLAGVIDSCAGYAGGDPQRADYGSVCTGTTGHAEAVRITYNPTRITYGLLLQVFFAIHDPTQVDGQGPDHGPQYRSALFPLDAGQRTAAAAYLRALASCFAAPIATIIEDDASFFPGEDHHQDYARLHPEQPYICRHALPLMAQVRRLFPDLLISTGSGGNEGPE